jgi:soluble lytic murein transglycosylase-like protein
MSTHWPNSPQFAGRSECIQIARMQAMAYSLESSLVCAVIEQESAWSPWATRYEPAFFAKYVAPLYTNQKISPTEAYGRAFSYGLMQVMGQVARERGFEGDFLPELCNPYVGVDIGCRHLAALWEKNHGDMSRTLLAWNGGGNPEYPQQVMARLGNYR